MPDPIKIISSMATKELMAVLGPLCEKATGLALATESVGGVDATRRVKAGEALDVVMLAAGAIDQLIAEGHVVAGSRIDLVRSGIAVAVRAGSPAPDIATESEVKKAVLWSKTVSYSTGPSGVYLEKLFEHWGITAEVKSRLVVAPPGVPVGRLVAEGKADLGFQQLSELMHLAGIDVVGPLPPEIQLITTFSAGIAATSTRADAARAVLDFMNSGETSEAKRRNGMEPA